jgi:AraC family transcriptional regulator, transcriptional activator of pobA
MKTDSLEDFYKQTKALLPEGISKEIGHFNVFDIAEVSAKYREKPAMPYNRRTYYKISLIKGHNIAEYADKVIEIKSDALLFATPKIPYNWLPQDQNQKGYFCIFTEEFMIKNKMVLDDLPIFKTGGFPVFQLSPEEAGEINVLFQKIHQEILSSYAFKYDLIRNYVMELIHYGQKLQPAAHLYAANNASGRVASLFIELLERQFPIENPNQRLGLRAAKDYAERLSVHVNHLNRVLKENTGKTTTDIIANRITQEAKILLKQTDWNISEVAYTLGFEEVAHFSNFFKKQTTFTPVQFRG